MCPDKKDINEFLDLGFEVKSDTTEEGSVRSVRSESLCLFVVVFFYLYILNLRYKQIESYNSKGRLLFRGQINLQKCETTNVLLMQSTNSRLVTKRFQNQLMKFVVSMQMQIN